MSNLTLGSLFDGSGGFPLGGFLSGIEPRWSSEIEPFPIRVTTKRLPGVKHLGDISKINGAEIEPVDIITFGSPYVLHRTIHRSSLKTIAKTRGSKDHLKLPRQF